MENVEAWYLWQILSAHDRASTFTGLGPINTKAIIHLIKSVSTTQDEQDLFEKILFIEKCAMPKLKELQKVTKDGGIQD